MAGCLTVNPNLFNACAALPPTGKESDNCNVVRSFIERGWNGWSPDYDKRLKAERDGGNDSYLPAHIEASLDEFLSPDVRRVRRDGSDRRVVSQGRAAYKKCISSVHALSQGLRIVIEDIIATGDVVTVICLISGQYMRVDDRLDLEGVLGAAVPTGQPYQVRAIQMYVIKDKKITLDVAERRGQDLQQVP